LRTLIVSDLHLGSASRVDLLRRPELRAPLLDELGDVERVVLLGDVLELRHGPRREALAAARPFFEDLGRALAGREVVIVAGNHDHALIEPWLERRSEVAVPAPLEAEQRIDAHAASPMMAQLAEWAAPARVTVAYPGLWVRPDVYATHGHYLDCHITIPTLERLGIGAMGRLLRRPASAFTGPEDYEAVMLPVFAWIDALARQAPTGAALNGGMTVRAWRTLGGGGATARTPGGSGAAAPTPGGSGTTARTSGGSDTAGRTPGVSRATAWAAKRHGIARALRMRALSGAFPLAVATLNRAGLGPLNADISSGELYRAGLRAMGEVTLRLGVGNAYVVFGHTHRAGPLPGDRTATWRTPSGARLMNTGCWTYDAYFLTPTPGESPYWPGGCVVVAEDGPPVHRGLLDAHTHAQLNAPVGDS
jgi:hypothetical protein